MKFGARILSAWALAIPLVSAAQGLWDEGMVKCHARTEYQPGFGLPDQPLVLRYDANGLEGCLFDAEQSFSGCPGRAGLPRLGNGSEVWLGTLHWNDACGGSDERINNTWQGCLSYRQSNFLATNPTSDHYWLLLANNDPSFDQCNPGPPGMSHPINSPWAADRGLFQFHIESGYSFARKPQRRFHLVLDSSSHDFYCEPLGGYQSSLPFISIGAQSNAGNGGPVGMMARNDNPGLVDLLSFEYEVIAHEPYYCLPETTDTCWAHYAGSHAGFYLLSEWGGVKRLLFVQMWRSGYFASDRFEPLAGKWNWPIEHSAFYPGAETALLPLGHPQVSACGLDEGNFPLTALQQKLTFEFRVSDLFGCAESLGLFTDLMPVGPIELQGVHWYAESYGTRGLIWTAVSGAQINRRENGGETPSWHVPQAVFARKSGKYSSKTFEN